MSSVFNLAKNYNRKRLFKKLQEDIPDIDRSLILSAQRHDPDALYTIGDLYYEKTEYLLAMAWYLRSCDRGNKDAQFKVGNMLYQGDGQAPDPELAYQFMQDSGKSGNFNAQNFLGWCHYNEKTVAKDMRKVADWCCEAASNGQMEAQYRYACMLENGEGVLKNDCLTREWYVKSANLGYQDTQEKLGLLQKGSKNVLNESSKYSNGNTQEQRDHIQSTMTLTLDQLISVEPLVSADTSHKPYRDDKEETEHQNTISGYPEAILEFIQENQGMREEIFHLRKRLTNLEDVITSISFQNGKILELLKQQVKK